MSPEYYNLITVCNRYCWRKNNFRSTKTILNFQYSNILRTWHFKLSKYIISNSWYQLSIGQTLQNSEIIKLLKSAFFIYLNSWFLKSSTCRNFVNIKSWYLWITENLKFRYLKTGKTKNSKTLKHKQFIKMLRYTTLSLD